MWPELLKQLRSGLVFNPLDELQKRATQYGTDIGEGLQAQRAQSGYAKSHPKSQRAQAEMMTNAMMMALQLGTGGPKTPKTWKPIEGVAAEHLARINLAAPEGLIAPAMANKKSGLYNTGIMHAEAVPGLLRYLAKTGGQMEANVNGWLTTHGRIVSKTEAYKIKKAELSPSVQAQIATRAQQSGKEPTLTSEDFRGKLYANKGTQADAPLTGADMDAIMARKKSGAPPDIGADALDALQNRGGFSFDTRTGLPVGKGFAVGAGSEKGHSLLKLSLKDATPEAIQDWFHQNVSKFPKGSIVGGWVDDAGVAHIEPSTLVANEAKAHKLGAARNQQEVYDFQKKESVPVRKLPPAADSVLGRIVGSITPRGADGLTDAQRAKAWDNRSLLSDVVSRGKLVDWDRIAPPKPEVIGVETPPLSGKLNPKSPVAGFILPFSEKAGKQLSKDNAKALQKMPPELIEVANIIHGDKGKKNPVRLKLHKDNPGPFGTPDPNEPTMQMKPVLDSLVADVTAMRGKPRVPSITDKHLEEFRKIDSTWNVAFKALQTLSKQIHDEPATRRNALADALRGGPKPPRGNPHLMGEYGRPDYISTVEAMKYAKQLPHQFQEALKAAKTYANSFYNVPEAKRSLKSRAIDIEDAARKVVKQGQMGIFVPPHATPAQAAAIVGLGEKLFGAVHNSERVRSHTELKKTLKAAMDAARFLHLKD